MNGETHETIEEVGGTAMSGTDVVDAAVRTSEGVTSTALPFGHAARPANPLAEYLRTRTYDLNTFEGLANALTLPQSDTEWVIRPSGQGFFLTKIGAMLADGEVACPGMLADRNVLVHVLRACGLISGCSRCGVPLTVGELRETAAKLVRLMELNPCSVDDDIEAQDVIEWLRNHSGRRQRGIRDTKVWKALDRRARRQFEAYHGPRQPSAQSPRNPRPYGQRSYDRDRDREVVQTAGVAGDDLPWEPRP